MVTGDSIQTAKAIALECGILAPDSDTSEPNVIEGSVFRPLSEKEREQIAKKISVMGRSSSNDKMLQVQALRKQRCRNGRSSHGSEGASYYKHHVEKLAVYQVLVLFVLNFWGIDILGLDKASTEYATKVKNTVIFNAFVLCQRPETQRDFEGVTKNHLFMAIVGLMLVLQVIIIEFLGKFTSTVQLSWNLWLVTIVTGLVSWPLAAVGKPIPVPETPLSTYLRRPFLHHPRAQNT